MSEPARIAGGAARNAGSWLGRLTRAWRALPSERRLAAGAAVGLFVTLFLPWYQETVVAAGKTAGASLSGWAAFSFVEAAVLLVAAAVLALLFQRAEGRAFHLPGGDGGVITAAGVWTCVLVVWRILDKESVSVRGPGTSVSGVEWGIFLALAVAALLAYAGQRIRRAHTPEPPLPDDGVELWMPDAAVPRSRRRAGPGSRRAARSRSSTREAPRTEVRPPRTPRAGVDHGFPTPDSLADPPTLRIGDQRRAPSPPPADVGDDEQLTIPFDEP